MSEDGNPNDSPPKHQDRIVLKDILNVQDKSPEISEAIDEPRQGGESDQPPEEGQPPPETKKCVLCKKLECCKDTWTCARCANTAESDALTALLTIQSTGGQQLQSTGQALTVQQPAGITSANSLFDCGDYYDSDDGDLEAAVQNEMLGSCVGPNAAMLRDKSPEISEAIDKPRQGGESDQPDGQQPQSTRQALPAQQPVPHVSAAPVSSQVTAQLRKDMEQSSSSSAAKRLKPAETMADHSGESKELLEMEDQIKLFKNIRHDHGRLTKQLTPEQLEAAQRNVAHIAGKLHLKIIQTTLAIRDKIIKCNVALSALLVEPKDKNASRRFNYNHNTANEILKVLKSARRVFALAIEVAPTVEQPVIAAENAEGNLEEELRVLARRNQ